MSNYFDSMRTLRLLPNKRRSIETPVSSTPPSWAKVLSSLGYSS